MVSRVAILALVSYCISQIPSLLLDSSNDELLGMLFRQVPVQSVPSRAGEGLLDTRLPKIMFREHVTHFGPKTSGPLIILLYINLQLICTQLSAVDLDRKT